MRITRLLQLEFAAMVAASAALATPITYTMTGTASGTLAGTAFTNAALTVTSVADTSQVFTIPPFLPPDTVYEVIAANSSISIAGFATATFTGQTFWLDPNGSGDIIFGVPGGSGFFDGILGFTSLFSGLESYDLESSFGPVSSPNGSDFETSVFNAFQNISTNEGNLSLIASNETFTAVATVPEPGTFILLGSALAFTCLIGSLRTTTAERFRQRNLAMCHLHALTF
jgi:hypothetical protein